MEPAGARRPGWGRLSLASRGSAGGHWHLFHLAGSRRAVRRFARAARAVRGADPRRLAAAYSLATGKGPGGLAGAARCARARWQQGQAIGRGANLPGGSPRPAATGKGKRASCGSCRALFSSTARRRRRARGRGAHSSRWWRGPTRSCILWLEARAEGDASAWHYTFARASDLELRATLDDKEVWTAEFAKFGQSSEAYFCLAPEFFREPPPENEKPAPPSRRSGKRADGSPNP